MLSNLLQKFKHNNTNIWIWKYCLLKIYLDYRELMTTGCWQQRNDSNSKKFTKENFWTLRIFSLIFWTLKTLETFLSSLLAVGTLEPLPTSASGGSLWAIFIAEALGFQEGFMPLMSSTCMEIAGNKFPFFFFILSHGQWVTFLLFAFES